MNDSTIPDKVLYASMQDIYETMDSPVPVTSLELLHVLSLATLKPRKIFFRRSSMN